MGRPRIFRREDGFSAVELCVASALLAFVMSIGVVTAQAALRSSNRIVRTDSVAGRIDVALERFQQALRPASLASLEAIPPGGTTPAPLVDGVVYDNLSFRRVVGFAAGAPILSPSPGAPPLRFLEVAGANGATAFAYDDGAHSTSLVVGGISVQFVKSGKQITFTLGVAAAADHPALSATGAVRLLSP